MCNMAMNMFDFMYKFSYYMLMDDKDDIGRYRYTKRIGHYYQGRKATEHPSMLHHWQFGMIGMFISQVGGIIVKGLDMYNDIKNLDLEGEEEGEEEENNVITLDAYGNELPQYPSLQPALYSKPL